MLQLLLYTITLSASLASADPITAPRIVKGVPCKLLDVVVDYVVSLSTWNLDHFCCGSLIRPDYVLTVAHCAEKHSSIYVVLLKDSRNSRSIPVQRKYVHPGYKRNRYDYDVAVLKMAAPASESMRLSYADLEEPTGGGAMEELCPVARLAGWGFVNEERGVPDRLMCVEIPVVDVRSCMNTYYQSVDGERNWVCTFSEKGRDGCQGDSGSPLVCLGTGKVIGVHSFGIGCGSSWAPAVSMRVDRFLGFVNDSLNKSAVMTVTTCSYSMVVMVVWNYRVWTQ